VHFAKPALTGEERERHGAGSSLRHFSATGAATTFSGSLACYCGSFQYCLFFPFLLQNIVCFKKIIAGRGMGVKQLLAFDSSGSEPGYLEVSGGLLVNAKGVRGFIYQGTVS